MARMNKRDQWQQEQAKLKAYGFKWRFAGIIEGEKGLPQKQWQLYTKDGEPISKVDALARIAREEEWKEAERWANFEASIHEVYWTGYFSEAVMECDELAMPAIHQEGESYVVFPAEVQITQEGGLTRYTLPSGKVFIMRDTLLYAEGEPGYDVPIEQGSKV
jgi:hypothetical protein